MRVLAFDAATESVSAALFQDGAVLEADEVAHAGPRGSGDRLLALIERLLAEAGLGLTALDGIAAGVGPGAFTGVRITVAAAQGLAFGAGLPVVPISTLEALAMSRLGVNVDRVFACLDARMHEIYWGSFAWDAEDSVRAIQAGAVAAPASVVLPEARLHHGVGRGLDAHPALLDLPQLIATPSDRLALPRARDMAELGARRLARGQGIDPGMLTPHYLRDKVALTELERGVSRTAK
jgi:tRNA threonylcarbamoyladenosine biosynthesis protein TsaB